MLSSCYNICVSMKPPLLVSLEFFPVPQLETLCFSAWNQRWSQGHKARGQGQGHKKNPRPRPRTAFPRTDPLEAKDRNAQAKAKDQGHKRMCSQKKRTSNFFAGDLQFIGVPRIFDCWRPKPPNTFNDVIKNFQKRKFLWDKDIVGWKI